MRTLLASTAANSLRCVLRRGPLRCQAGPAACRTDWRLPLLVLLCLCASTGRLPAQETPAVPDGLVVAAAMEQSIIAAIEKAAPSVVAIARVPKAGAVDVAQEFQFNVPTLAEPAIDPTDPSYVPLHFASGVILSSDGLILTCYHALDDPRQNDYYVWWKGKNAKATVGRALAKVQAGDPWTDLAVLKIEATGLPEMPMGDARELRRGSAVISLGNPYATARDGEPSASWGIVSNLQRAAVPNEPQPDQLLQDRQSLAEFGTLIQTDAKLNLGSSGGALINLRGQMVGLTTSLASVAGYDQAAGYAIPIDGPTLKIIESLRAGRQPAFGFLGVEPTDSPTGRGAQVARVVPGLPGEQAGLLAGDVIYSVAGVPTNGAQALFRELSRQPANSEVEILVARFRLGAAQREKMTVQLGKKQLSLAKPSYSAVPEPTWRGLQVDWATALPPLQLLSSRRSGNAEVAILRVDPDTPAWQAGLRPGQYVLRVNQQPISRPEQFYESVADDAAEVSLEIISNSGRPQRVVVSPAKPD